MSKPNNSPEAKAAWKQIRRDYGSKHIKIRESQLSSRRHRKDYKAKQGKFSERALQSLAGRNWKLLIPYDGRKWVGTRQIVSTTH